MKKKALSLVLALVMVLSLFPDSLFNKIHKPASCRYFLQYTTGSKKCQQFLSEKERGQIYAIFL